MLGSDFGSRWAKLGRIDLTCLALRGTADGVSRHRAFIPKPRLQLETSPTAGRTFKANEGQDALRSAVSIVIDETCQSMRRRMLAVQEDAAPLVEWASGFVSGSKIDGCDDQNSTPCCHYPQ